MKRTIENVLHNPWVELAARLFLGATFLYACFSKIVHPAQFAKIVYGYGLFPEFSVNLIAILIPWVEFFAAMALILGVFPSAGAFVINGMLVLYMVVISINLVRGYEFDCGCFSMEQNGNVSPEELLIRDIFYLIIGFYILLYDKKRVLVPSRAVTTLKEWSHK